MGVKMPRGAGLASPPVSRRELTCTPRRVSFGQIERVNAAGRSGHEAGGAAGLRHLLSPAHRGPVRGRRQRGKPAVARPLCRDVLPGRILTQDWKPYEREQPAPAGGQGPGVALGQPHAHVRDHAMHTPFPHSAWRRRRVVLPRRGCLWLRLCSDAEPVSVASAPPDPAPHRPQHFVSALPGAPIVVTAGLFLPAVLGLELVKGYAEQYLLEADI